jgi:catechol 2,3-dioxygenase-like lactoylglutathione lyase family enzyme
MPRVIGLGHVGLYVRDLERMVGFYRDVMGMQVTKQNWRLGIVFLSADPETVDHEIALMRGRPSAEDPHLIQQISMRAASLDDLRAFHRRLQAEGYRIENVVNDVMAWERGRREGARGRGRRGCRLRAVPAAPAGMRHAGLGA